MRLMENKAEIRDRDWYLVTRKVIKDKLNELNHKNWLKDESVLEEMKVYTDKLMWLHENYGHLY